ncbi:MAG: bifunctional 4-hydroxy-3-methylbut-2-enyl diphosphate reductase/30S ribosomal protein S1 [Ruminococcaceae bacterium]|nr:bifunctional 4-hydroxy-3-methylbut-2-enyl diphosphate reductase/30S ribosomal protein S1 [Oscillospiraceae bacterium]
MEIITAKYAGFCFGVKRAVDAVFQLAKEKPDAHIYTVGELIHNPNVNEKLRENGIDTLSESNLDEELKYADSKSVFVVRTHGIPSSALAALQTFVQKNPQSEIADMTCPFVAKIYRIMEKNTSDDTFTVVIGTATHPEVIGIASYIRGDFRIFSGFSELSKAFESDFAQEIGAKSIILASQTTHNLEDYQKCKKFLKNLYTNALFFDTICNVTETRQKEIEKLSRECDAMLVIGGRESSNTKKLYDISREHCSETHFIETAHDIPFHIKQMTGKVGIAAGASTPGYIIEEVQNTMSEQENFAQLLEESFKTLNTGDTVRGIVTSVTNTEVHVDIGSKVTGVLTIENVTDDPQAKLENLFKVGDEVEAVAVRVSDLDGIATLSKKKVDAHNNWTKVVEAKENEEIIEGKITEAVKGGVIAYALSQKIFIPASQTNVPKNGDLQSIVGTKQRFKIIEIKEDRKRAIGSIRVVIREERKALLENFWANIEVGKHYTGKVKSLTSYGAFVDLGGVDGMVHTTELSWLRISSPKDVVSIGDTLEVFVKDFDREKNRISLGYKTEDTNPWKLFTDKYSIGDVASVKIVSMMPFGAFAQIIPGVDGLIHITQIANKRIAAPAEVLELGQVVDAKIIDIDTEKHKVSLSIRALIEAAAEEAAE